MNTLTVATKTCTKCGETKPLSEFHRNRNAPDGHAYACKPCRVADAKASQAKRRERMGDELYRAMKAADVRYHRRVTDNATGKAYAKARHQAVSALIERHRDEFEHLLLLARRGELT